MGVGAAADRRTHKAAILLAPASFSQNLSTVRVTTLRQADVDAGVKPGVSGSESAELREARKRIRLLEQENEVLRRAAAYLSQAHLPGKGSTRS